jgi:phosphatidylcholine synthase
MREDVVTEPPNPPAPSSSRGLRLAGAALHLYPASGSVLALFIVVAAVEGRPITALWLGLVALVIDGTDGMLARRLRVKETIPWFDGARLDDIVDYLTYVFAPVVLLWAIGRLPDGATGWVVAALPLLASGYQFCRVDAKTADHFFLGFPSYWNVLAFYAVVLDLGTATVAVLIVVCAVLVFVPVRYVYPSRTEFLWQLNLGLTVLWLVSYAVLLAQVPDPNPVVVAASLGYLF